MDNNNDNVIRKPIRSYPLPENIGDLDNPHPDSIRSRYERVDKFNEGYNPGDSPLIVPPSRSPSDLLDKL